MNNNYSKPKKMHTNIHFKMDFYKYIIHKLVCIDVYIGAFNHANILADITLRSINPDLNKLVLFFKINFYS